MNEQDFKYDSQSKLDNVQQPQVQDNAKCKNAYSRSETSP